MVMVECEEEESPEGNTKVSEGCYWWAGSEIV